MIGLHAVAMLAAFTSGGLITLWAEAPVQSDRDVFGWSGVGAGVLSLLLFVFALVLR